MTKHRVNLLQVMGKARGCKALAYLGDSANTQRSGGGVGNVSGLEQPPTIGQ